MTFQHPPTMNLIKLQCTEIAVIKKTYPRGRELIEFCTASRMRILNGRAFGDFHGAFTYCGPHGSSTIDLCIVNEDILPQVNSFYVTDCQTLSPHSRITTCINTTITQETYPEIILHNTCSNYTWEENSDQKIQDALNNNTTVQRIIQLFLSTDFPSNNDGINAAASIVDNIL